MISRRTFLAAGAGVASAAPRFNVLLLIADNWAAPHASIYGDPVVKTPVFDRVAREGVVFSHAFAPNPSCSPSRSSLLAGQETHRLGEAASLYGPLDAAVPLFTDLLAGAGYHTGFTGKGLGPGTSRRPAGRPANPAGESFADFAAFRKARPKEKPWCFWFGSHDPHVPWNRGRTAKVEESKISIPAHLPDDPAVRKDLVGYYQEIQQFDRECGEILTALEKAGELDRTLVVMTSDNGWQMPRGLANCYDLGVRIPLAMRLPAKIAAGSRRDDFVSIAALAPTILETCNLHAPKSMTARSLYSGKRRNEVFLERERHANVRRGDLSYPVRGVRTREFLYLRNLEPDRWPAGDPEMYWAVGPYGDVDNSFSKLMLLAKKPEPYFSLIFGKRPAEELYDLRKDAGQVKNVAGEKEYAGVKRRLAARVDAWMKATADPRARGATGVWDKAPYSGRKGEQGPPGA
ncbi:MAG: sulfatase [Acidobacteria bacterium]|nr:sulfatase [Acidobacteriota bacterium]